MEQRHQIIEYSQEIMEIHSAIDNVAEQLLAEAKKFLDASDFINTSNPISVSGTKANIDRQLAEKIIYFQINYPNNKFIIYKQVEEVCLRYNLVCGDLEIYNGFIPQRNRQMIENFKIKNEDAGTEVEIIATGPLSNGKKTKVDINDSKKYLKTGFYTKGDESIATLKICAPIKDFNLKGMNIEIKDGIIVLDPIVLQPIKGGGYLVVTKWGDEAKDENVINHNHN